MTKTAILSDKSKEEVVGEDTEKGRREPEDAEEEKDVEGHKHHGRHETDEPSSEGDKGDVEGHMLTGKHHGKHHG